MMAKPQRIIETSAPTPLGLSWCAQCGQEYWMITPESAAAIAGVNTLTIYDWAYSGRIHFMLPMAFAFNYVIHF